MSSTEEILAQFGVEFPGDPVSVAKSIAFRRQERVADEWIDLQALTPLLFAARECGLKFRQTGESREREGDFASNKISYMRSVTVELTGKNGSARFVVEANASSDLSKLDDVMNSSVGEDLIVDFKMANKVTCYLGPNALMPEQVERLDTELTALFGAPNIAKGAENAIHQSVKIVAKAFGPAA